MSGFTKNLAVVIGINQYGNGIAPLQTAVEDAEYLGQLLKQNHHYEVVTLINQAASLENLRHLFEKELPAQITEHVRLLIYFAGHGIAKATYGTEAGTNDLEGPAGYLIPQDAQPEDEASFLPMQKMYQALEKLPCKHFLLILDCCFAGAFRWASTRDILVPEKMYRQRFERFEREAAWQVLTSASHDQKALDILRDNRSSGSTPAHSPFATALYEALAGGADLIQDQVITATELYLYLRDAVETRSEERQTPGLWPLPKHNSGEFFFLTEDFDSSRLEEAPVPSAERNPYRGLQAYDERHGALFFGRDKLIKSLYREHVLRDSLTVVVGASGTGKSSLVKAGLIPYLRKADYLQRRQDFNDVAEQVREDWRILPILRPGNNPLLALAQMLLPLSPLQLSDEALEKLQDFQAVVTVQFVHLPDTFVSSWRKLTEQPKGQLILVLEWAKALEERLNQQGDAAAEALETLQALVASGRQLIAQLQRDDTLIKDLLEQWLAATPNTHVLLVIDQAEELITQVNNEGSRQRFIDYLEAALEIHPEKLHCVLTVRMDFEPLVKQLFSPTWQTEWDNQFRQVVPPMTQADLRDAIEGPANEAVLHFEEHLVDDLINEVVQMPGALPLLSFTLSELYIKCVERFQRGDLNRALTQDDYVNLDKVSGSLQSRANQEFESRDAAKQRTLRNMMLRMVAFEGGEWARRRVPKTELVYSDPEENQRVEEILNGLVEQRLLISGRTSEGEYVEPAHDALIRGWEKILEWLNETVTVQPEPTMRERLLRVATRHRPQQAKPQAEQQLAFNIGLQRQLTAAAQRWWRVYENSQQKARPYLWNGDPRLPQLVKVEASEESWLNQQETSFVGKSFGRERFNKRFIRIIFTVVLVVVSGLGIAAEVQRRTAVEKTQLADDNADEAQKQQGIAEANAAEAQKQQGIAEANAAEAEKQRLEAETNAATAEEQRQQAQEQQKRAEKGEAEANRQTKKALEQQQISLARQLIAQANSIREYHGSLLPTSILLASEASKILLQVKLSNGGAVEIANADQTLRNYTLMAHKITDLSDHSSNINAISFSPDGRYVATGGSDNTTRVWDTQSGQEIAQMNHDFGVMEVRFSPNGRYVATVERYGTARLWNMQNTQTPVWVNYEVEKELSFSPDGHYVVTAGDDNTARVWETLSGQEIARMNHDDTVNAVRFSPDGRYIVTASDDNTARVWETLSGQEIAQMNHDFAVQSVGFSPNGRYVITGSNNTSVIPVRVWDSQSGEEIISRINPGEFVQALIFRPNGRHLATVSGQTTLTIWSLRYSREIARMNHDDTINAVSFSPDGRYVVTASDDNTARVWDPQSGQEIARMNHDDTVNAARFSPDGRYVVTASDDDTARMWDIHSRKEVVQMNHGGVIRSASFSSDGRYVATGEMRGKSRVWSVQSGQVIATIEHDATVKAVDFSPDGRYVATSGGRIMRVWDIQGNQEIAQMSHERTRARIGDFINSHVGSFINSVRFSPDGRYIATGSEDRTARVWDAQSGQEIAQMNHDFGVMEVRFSPNGRYVATVERYDKTRVWDAQSGQIIAQMNHDDPVYAMNFSPDGRYIATAGRDNMARVWDAQSGQEIVQMNHDNPVNAVSFSPDGRYVATGSSDNTARVWDLQSNQEIARINHDDPVNAVSFSPDGRYVATITRSKVEFWHVFTEDLIEPACRRLHRNLTLQEWRRYIGEEEPYRRTCQNLPYPDDYEVGSQKASESSNQIISNYRNKDLLFSYFLKQPVIRYLIGLVA